MKFLSRSVSEWKQVTQICELYVNVVEENKSF